MTFAIVYRQEVAKLVQFITLDSRVELGLQGMNGVQVQPYIDAVVEQIGTNPYFYIIETNGGSVAGYFTLVLRNGTMVVANQQFRPQYSEFLITFNTMIEAFLASGNWGFDVLA